MKIFHRNIKYGYYLLGVGAFFTITYFVVKKIINNNKVSSEKEEGGSENGYDSTSTTNYAENAQTQHFSLSEFNSNDGVEVPKQYRGNVQKLMEQLEVLKTELGGAKIFINSGYRSPAHNRAVGGVSNSQHLYGKASDIRTLSHSPSQIKNAIEKLQAEGKMIQGGIGLYPTFVHYDIRGTRSRWNG
jgi:uncharacterized protein YcbK (DUF882 family)